MNSITRYVVLFANMKTKRGVSEELLNGVADERKENDAEKEFGDPCQKARLV